MAVDNLTVVVTLVDTASKKMGVITGALASLTKAVALAGVAVAALGVTIGVKAVKEFAKFEKAMSNVEAITGATTEEMKQMEDVAKKMGATTAFTAEQAAEGMTFLGMAGFETGEIMKAIPGTLALAAASNIELGRAADIASNVLTGFRLNAEETDRVVDVLAKTVTSSNTNMEQLAEGMKLFAPSAAAFGVSIEEASATVGILGNAGLQGSIATQALATSMVRLSKPTAQMSSKMKELNLDFFDANGQFIGLTESVAMLEDRYKTLTPEQQANATATIFGARAVKQWNVLVAAGSDELTRFTGELENSSGTAQTMADIQLDNLSGAFTLMQSAVNGVFIEIGSKLAPTLTEATRKFTAITTEALNSGAIMQFVEAVISNVKIGFNFLKEAVDNAKRGFDFFGQGLQFTNTIFGENGNLIEDIKKLYKELKPIIDVLSTSFGVGLKVAIESVAIVINGLVEGMNVLLDVGKQVGRLIGKMTGRDTDVKSSSKLFKMLGFADGGIVPDTQYFAKGGQAKGSDTVPAMLTPGELILNKAQQKNLSGNMGGITINIDTLIGKKEFAMEMGDMIVRKIKLSTATV